MLDKGKYTLNIKIQISGVNKNDNLVKDSYLKNIIEENIINYLNTTDIDYEISVNSRFNKIKPINIEEGEEIINNKKWYNDNFPWNNEIENLNKNILKNHNFKPNQKAILNSVLSDNDVFACMPTGYGKSLIFQISCLYLNDPVVVIYPWLSLIEDQYKNMKFYGINVIKYCNKAKLKDIIKANNEKKIDWILTSPEKLLKGDNLLLFEKIKISKVFIDESHCVYQWGNDFRVEFGKIGNIKLKFPHINLICLTATATTEIRNFVIKKLNMNNHQLFQASFNRPNLFLEVINKENVDCTKEIHNNIIRYFLKNSGIIYVTKKKLAESLAKDLNKLMMLENNNLFQNNNNYYEAYHSKIGNKSKVEILQKWKNNEIFVIIATVAFGMGIDKENVRFIFHYNMPFNLENYYQEIGRSGRDGLPSFCKLYYTLKDRQSINYIMKGSKNISRELINLYKVILYCENKFECRKKQILAYLGETFENCKFCDNCYNIYKLNKNYTIENLVHKINIKDIANKWIEYLKENSVKLTINKLLDKWKRKMSKLGLNLKDSAICLYIILSKKHLYEKKYGKKFIYFNIHPYKRSKVREDIFYYKFLENKISDFYNNINYLSLYTTYLQKINKLNYSFISELEATILKIRFNLFKEINVDKDELDIFFPLSIVSKIISNLPTTEEELKNIIYLDDNYNDIILQSILKIIKKSKLENNDIINYKKINRQSILKEKFFERNSTITPEENKLNKNNDSIDEIEEYNDNFNEIEENKENLDGQNIIQNCPDDIIEDDENINSEEENKIEPYYEINPLSYKIDNLNLSNYHSYSEDQIN